MGSLNRTETVSGSCTRQTLYDLINTSTITGLSDSDIISTMSATAASEPPAEITNHRLWYDQTQQLLKFPVTSLEGSAASFWMSVGPDRWDYPGYNVCVDYMLPGDVVRWSYSPAAGIYDITFMEPTPTWYTLSTHLRANPPLYSCYGLVAATIAPQQFGPVATIGIAHAKIDWNSVYQHDDTLAMKYSWALHLCTQYTATLYCINSTDACSLNAPYVGQTLNSPGSNSTACTYPGAVFFRFPLGYRPSRAV